MCLQFRYKIKKINASRRKDNHRNIRILRSKPNLQLRYQTIFPTLRLYTKHLALSMISTKKNDGGNPPCFLFRTGIILFHKDQLFIHHLKAEVIMKTLKLSLEMALFVLYPAFVLVVIAISLL